MTELNADAAPSPRVTGVGRLLIVVYGILALAATGRSATQLIERFHEAPVAYLLSALSAVVYIVATVALVFRTRPWYRVAWATIGFEMAGVLVIGTVSVLWPSLLGQGGTDPFGRQSTVWSAYGMGYLFIPLVLPVLGMWWLATHRPVSEPAPQPEAADAA